MKMNRQNPGGENPTPRTMKGCEKYMARGKGSIETGYAPGRMKKFDQGSEGALQGAAKAGSVYIPGGHALTSTSGATVTGSGKGLK